MDNKIVLTERDQLLIEGFVRVAHKLGMPINEDKMNELGVDTYAKQMSNTSNYPTKQSTQSQSPDDHNNPKFAPNKEARVNGLSRERFEAEFMKKYPQGSKLNSSAGELNFKGLRFNSNGASYSLMFGRNGGQDSMGEKSITISMDGGGPNGLHIDEKGLQLDSQSLPIAQEMLKYNKY